MNTRFKIRAFSVLLVGIMVALFLYFNQNRSSDIVEEDVSPFIPKKINLIIPEKSFSKILSIREKALERGFLTTEDDSWVKGYILNEDSSKIKIELRLKGDLLDHLKGEKWSYRIKVKKGKSWNRLKTFSLQNPSVREFLNEWFYHKFLEKEGVLCPRYDFIELSVNGVSKGIYAYEEHFDKQLVESRNRREGPLVKFTEDGIWAGRKRGKEHFGELKYPTSLTDFYESSDIKAFKEGRTLRDSILFKQYLTAHRLMTQYKYQLKKPGELFDIEKLASFYAVVDICGAYHGLFWNNQRFYFNPIIQKMEPIAYDGFSHASNWTKRPFYGYGMYNKNQKYDDGPYVFYNQLFIDSLFMTNYIQKLYRMSDANYISNLYTELESEIRKREVFLQKEYKDYVFNRDRFKDNATDIAALILPFDKISVKAFPKNDSVVAILNHHKLPISMIGTGKSIDMIERFQNPKTLPVQINFKIPYEYTELVISDMSHNIYYKLLGIDSVFTCQVSPIKLNEEDVPQQKVLEKYSILNQSIQGVSVIGKEIYFNGNITIDKLLVIPSNHTVIIKEGTKIDFVNGSGLVSYSHIIAIGSEENPITITSSDYRASARGFTVLQAGEASKLKNVNFSNFNALGIYEWNLTGAITFYESDVLIDNCTFTNNLCEDMLNIIRSKFEINQLSIYNSFSDAFDADFSTGKIENSSFYNIVNNAMDFSGSTIKANSIDIKNAGDKGISVGEQSEVYGNDITITGAEIGLASKDLSRFEVHGVSLTNCKIGLTAFEKKSEYGGAKLIIKNIQKDNVDKLYEVQKNSFLKIDDNVITE